MVDVIFSDFQDYIVKALLDAKYEVKIAVAWLNFDMYKNIFKRLLEKNIDLRIVINGDFINARYDKTIAYLEKKGAKIYKIKMPTKNQYMHEKFCIIDDKRVLNGSYNWSRNANKNFENLMSSTKKLVIYKFIAEFDKIIGMDTEYIRELQQSNSHNILVLEEDNDSTKATVYEIKNGDLYEVMHDFYEFGVYGKLIGIFKAYDDKIDEVYDDTYDIMEIKAEMDFLMHRYLSHLSKIRTSAPIHGVGVVASEMLYGDIDDIYIKILWKERFCEPYIEDRYGL